MRAPTDLVEVRRLRLACPICGRRTWCSVGPKGTVCMRSKEGGTPTANAGRFHPGVYPTGYGDVDYSMPALAEDEAPLASIDRRDMAYRALLSALALRPEHFGELLERGLAPEEISARMYRSMPPPLHRDWAAEKVRGLGIDVEGVPGFWHGRRDWLLAGSNGILLPSLDMQGRVQACQIRLDRDMASATEAKYHWLSSAGKSRGTTSHAPIHVALPTDTDHVVNRAVWVTEGVLKSDIAAERLGTVVLGLGGVSNWRGVMDLLRHLPVPDRRVCVAFDADKDENPQVADNERGLVQALVRANYVVGRADWDPEVGKGIDDVLIAGYQPVTHRVTVVRGRIVAVGREGRHIA